MKRLFFFKSSSSSSGNTQAPPPIDKQVNWENTSENGLGYRSSDKTEKSSQSSSRLFSNVQKPGFESQNSATNPCLRRSLSFSSVAFNDNEVLEPRKSFCSSSSGSIPSQQLNYSSRCHSLTPEKQLRAKPYEAAADENENQIEKPRSTRVYSAHSDSAENSSCSNVSSTVLDLYIDGEQQQERSKTKNVFSKRINATSGNGNGSRRRPPRAQYTAPASPIHDAKGRATFHSFREPAGSQVYFSSKDWPECELGNEVHRKLAQHVIEKLSQPHVSTKSSIKDFDPKAPITIEEICGKSSHRSSGASPQVSCKNFSLDEPYATVDGFYPEEPFGFQKQNYFINEDLDSVDIREDTSEELKRKIKEAKERVFFLSEELEWEKNLQDVGLNVPALVQKIRLLTEERLSLAIEVSSTLQGRIEDRASAKENLRLAKTELDSRTQRLEKEKNELQKALEKELDRRSSDWSFKLEKYQSEEQRLRERVRELAEQNVSLQREVSSFSEKVAESRSMIKHLESQLGDLTLKMEEMRQENQDLQQNLSGLQEKYLVAEEERGCILRNYNEKENDCQELQKSISRLLRTCSEQEKTVGGLREELNKEIENQSYEKFDRHVGKLQMEHMRLTGVEQALRREVESCKFEVDSLRHENINLLNRLKASAKEGGFCTFKLDQELCNRVCCLQKQGLLLLNESTQLCSKLLEVIKGKAGYISETKQCVEAMKEGLDRQFVVESDVKVQGFKRGTENLVRSLQTMSALLQEKANITVLESQSYSTQHVESGHVDSEEFIKSELKAESLLTRALRDKLFSKQLDVEQLQAELAAAVRGNDILRCEVQNAMDTLSCATHKLKDLELQMLKKDENTSRLHDDFQEATEELTLMRGILPKVSQERDLMWEEVKQYSEKNMLLNSEVNMLNRKIEVLEEDVLLKEGQITILKDSLGNKTFDLLTIPEPMDEFRLE